MSARERKIRHSSAISRSFAEAARSLTSWDRLIRRSICLRRYSSSVMAYLITSRCRVAIRHRARRLLLTIACLEAATPQRRLAGWRRGRTRGRAGCRPSRLSCGIIITFVPMPRSATTGFPGRFPGRQTPLHAPEMAKPRVRRRELALLRRSVKLSMSFDAHFKLLRLHSKHRPWLTQMVK
jgi:hypothetical protein